ncbi:rCG32703 [Rattus norvegicus]|uniref:RCG32703 n=1 Tax=Rattus norvegicus TaxID=10116 RepID=A6HDE5_RAT|nr:rCG32703 [Rattus norvegicus]
MGHLCLDAPENIMLETEVSISGLKETVKTFVSQRQLAETQQRLRLL